MKEDRKILPSQTSKPILANANPKFRLSVSFILPPIELINQPVDESERLK